MPSLTEHIKASARDLGFAPVGVAPAEPPEHRSFYLDWLGLGYGGEMGYLERNLDRRFDPRCVLPNARSVLCVGMNYEPKTKEVEDVPASSGKISRYARGDDYHHVIGKRLHALLEEIRKLEPDTEGKVYVDTGPVLERDLAARAGLGWFGKNTNLINKERGSWFFLGEIFLSLELDYDRPETDHCGTCNLCIEACPTEAIREPYLLDSRQCISYLTIELKGSIPEHLRAGMGDWIYGCDICQEVCPWNEKHAEPTDEFAYQPREGRSPADLHELLQLDQAGFSGRFNGSPIKRAKRRGLLRNVAVAIGNQGRTEDIGVLGAALSDPEPLVRGHSAWALGQIGGEAAVRALGSAMESEPDSEVIKEIRSALREAEGETREE